MTDIGLEHYLTVAAILFVCGLLCMVTKRNAIGILIGVELILNAGMLNLMAFSYYSPLGMDGQMLTIFVIILAAAEAAVALAIFLNFYYTHLSVDVDQAEELKG